MFGRLNRSVTASRAGEQASESDLAAARLAVLGELAANYFGLREADAQRAILQATLAGYERTLQIARNRYEAGIVARTDVLQAQNPAGQRAGRPDDARAQTRPAGARIAVL